MLEKMSLRIRCPDYQPRWLLLQVLTIMCFLAAALSAGASVYAAVPNSQYSLAGAEYQLYTDEACTVKAKDSDGNNAVLETDENGDSNVLQMAPGTYYAKEIKAGKGFRLDTDEAGKPRVYTIEVSASDTESEPATFTSSEPPVFGIPELMVFKTDTSGAYSYTKLLGAKFTVKYYDVLTKEEIKDAEPKDEWTFEAVKKDSPSDKPEGTYMAGFNWQTDEPVSYTHEGGGSFYEVIINGETKRVLPLGWFTIEETEAPAGFWLSDKICYGHIYQPEEGGGAVTEIEGARVDPRLNISTLTFTDEPYPSISTTASLQSGNREVKDIITYDNLIPDERYLFKGWLVDKATGKKVPGSDGSISLDAKKASGQVEMVLNAEQYDGMQGRSMTAFEELYLVRNEGTEAKETLLAEHKDVNDRAQTVEIFQDVKVKKNVTGNLGDLSKVFEYKAVFSGLEPGKPYKVEGFDEKTFNADPDGSAVIPLKLRDDKSVTIKQLPKGATYRITEAASDHVAEFKVFSEDMAKKGAKIVQAAGSNDSDAAKELSTAIESVDLLDGTVVVLWENNRDLATITAVQSYLGIWACGAALTLAGLAVLIIKMMKHTEG